MRVAQPPTIVAADHPSLDGAIDQFLTALRTERRFLGPSGSANPKPSRTLVDALADRAGGFRLAVVDAGRVVALARVAADGDLRVAVAADRRGAGMGTVLASAVVERARALGMQGLCLRSSRRSRPALAMAAQLGFMIVDRGHGRLDLVLDLTPRSHTA